MFSKQAPDNYSNVTPQRPIIEQISQFTTLLNSNIFLQGVKVATDYSFFSLVSTG